eukprot:TRINITY_DN9324_c1_g1_i2.p1 TRINITY_DN9324_c1_g1~~TRINITY_DN9324_c1_g1_i2.p1  ORF type:complete len:337 (+),score=59.13 TRINITY_DN9324_c1_g1_i2:24-1034(+)
MVAAQQNRSRLWLCAAAVTSGTAVLAWLEYRRRRARRAQPGRPVRLRSGLAAAPVGPLVPQNQWKDLPDWIQLDDVRGSNLLGKPFPNLGNDPLFQDNGDPKLLPFFPPESVAKGRGAAVICPGGNYEFLAPYEGEPVARWLAEGLGIPAFVLKYRLLPEFGLSERCDDLSRAVQVARDACGGGPVVVCGFSAGGHLTAKGGSVPTSNSSSNRPDAQVLVYPCIDPTTWLDEDLAGFWNVQVDTPQVKSLVDGWDKLQAGPDFVVPPPSFIVACEEDDVCKPSEHTDPYVKAIRESGANVEYIVGKFGGHGFGLKDFWTVRCLEWLHDLGFGRVAK